MRQKKIIANWKLNADYVSIKKFIDNISEVENVDLLVAPSYIGLLPTMNLAKKRRLSVIAQNTDLVTVGNHTGSTSWIELKDYGIKTVIVGHPEVTKTFNESSVLVNKKVKTLLENNMKVVLCIDESRTDLLKDSTKEAIRLKIKKSLEFINKSYLAENLLIVYKPTFVGEVGLRPTPTFIVDTIKVIRNFLREEYGFYIGNHIPLLYGGDFLSEDVEEIVKSDHIDGLFIDDEKAVSAKYVSLLIKYLYKYSTDSYAKFYENNLLITEPLESNRYEAKKVNLSFDEYEIDNDIYFKEIDITEEEI
ncbi:triose-phosphate isomerase [Malacoplasma muris]|uniref:triose-phosphate isomerase n=1 Tax=Malacoplasma muris TaxID=2119 RepID=UPI00398F6069